MNLRCSVVALICLFLYSNSNIDQVIHPKKRAKKKSYKNSGTVWVKAVLEIS
jgi:hypothetical protein